MLRPVFAFYIVFCLQHSQVLGGFGYRCKDAHLCRSDIVHRIPPPPTRRNTLNLVPGIPCILDPASTMVVVVGQVPDVSLSAPDMPSGDVDASVSAPDMPSGDVDANVSAPDMPSGDVDASVSVPDIPSVDVKAPKKKLFGKFLKKKSSKASVEVRFTTINHVPFCLYLAYGEVFSRRRFLSKILAPTSLSLWFLELQSPWAVWSSAIFKSPFFCSCALG